MSYHALTSSQSRLAATAAALLAFTTACSSEDPAFGEAMGSTTGDHMIELTTAVAVPGEGDPHAIVVAETAGGMQRNISRESELKQQLAAAEQQFKAQSASSAKVTSAVYSQDDSARGPVGDLVFLGAEVDEQSAAAFAKGFAAQARANGFNVKRIDPGARGGIAVCAEQSKNEKVAICAWGTHDSMGELVPTVPGYGAGDLAPLLLAVRENVETRP